MSVNAYMFIQAKYLLGTFIVSKFSLALVLLQREQSEKV